MHSISPRTLTWLTLVAALCSAVLLAGEDAGLPDPRGLDVIAPGVSGGPTPRRSVPALPHRTREVDTRRRER